MELFRHLPNIITLGRLCLVPLSIVLIASQEWTLAFVVFVCAGLSDALDGWLAKRFKLETELGAYLDPLADKALLVSIYVTLALGHQLPVALAVLVVSRDVMIISAVLISFALGKPVKIKPLFISKLNTTAQIAFAGLILATKAFDLALGTGFNLSLAVVAALTLASAGAYLMQWFRHMAE